MERSLSDRHITITSHHAASAGIHPNSRLLGFSAALAPKFHPGQVSGSDPSGSQEVPRRPQEAPGGLRRPQEVPGGPRRPQEVPGGPRRPQETPGGPRRPQEAPGGPRRPQEGPRRASGGPRRSQKGPRRPQEDSLEYISRG